MTKATNPVVDILVRARARISDPERWFKHWFAMSAKGVPVNARSRRAVCWCSLGAIKREAGGYTSNYRGAIAAFGKSESGIAAWNDVRGRTHAEILAGFDRAIELASAAGGAT
jgi:hypothetical protein